MKRITYTYFLFFVMVFSVSSNAQGLGGLGGLKDLNPLKSNLYAIDSQETEVKPEPEKKYSIYGEYWS